MELGDDCDPRLSGQVDRLLLTLAERGTYRESCATLSASQWPHGLYRDLSDISTHWASWPEGVLRMSTFKLPEGIARPTGTPDKPGKGAVIKPTRFYVYPDGHGYLFFENPVKGDEDISVPFDRFYDAITFLSMAFYEAQKIAEKQPQD